MGTDIHPEVSKHSKYWLSKHRYYELKHFCLQYEEWKEELKELDGYPTQTLKELRREIRKNDPTSIFGERRVYYSERIDMVETVAMEAGNDLGHYLLESVTTGLSYEKLRAKEMVPCCKQTFYTVYRRFFWLLDKARK